MNTRNLLSKYIFLLLGIVLSISSVPGLDWHYDTSVRIEALGIDFAGVLKDLQTDIEIRNTTYLKGYRALTIFHKGYFYNWSMPLNFSLFQNHFGLALKYGGHYFLNTNTAYPKNQLSRFNLSGYYAKTNLGIQYDFYIEDQKLDYVTAVTQKLSENLTFHTLTLGYHLDASGQIDVRCRLGFGTYDSAVSEFISGQLTPVTKTDFFVPSAQIGLSYEKPILENTTLSLLVDLGGPASGFELKRLPVPFQSTVKRDDQGNPSQFDFFANSFSTRVAGAISFLPSRSLLVVLGVNNFGNGAKTKQEKPITAWNNVFTLPIAIEWRPNEAVAVRGGIRAEYYYLYSKQENPQISSFWPRSQSLGLGFRLFQDWYLDLTSLSNLLQIESIDLSLRKEWH